MDDVISMKVRKSRGNLDHLHRSKSRMPKQSRGEKSHHSKPRRSNTRLDFAEDACALAIRTDKLTARRG